MPRPKDTSYTGDPEYTQFEQMISDRKLCPATAKSYKASYRKCRNLFQKPIRDTAEDTAWKTIRVAEENINTVQALINICILVRQLEPVMPHDELIEQRTLNKQDVDEHLKQANAFKTLPELSEYDAFVDSLWSEGKYREYIINFLMRHYYVRNQDLMFDIVDTKTETLADRCKNYLWVNKSKKCITYIRNLYKTAKIYGQKSYDIKNERFIRAVKCCQKYMYAFPICDDPSLIGYHIKNMSFNKLGEGNCLKIIINHYRDNYVKIKEISQRRGTDMKTLMESYNINYNMFNDTNSE